jgi:hypothetical protein
MGRYGSDFGGVSGSDDRANKDATAPTAHPAAAAAAHPAVAAAAAAHPAVAAMVASHPDVVAAAPHVAREAASHAAVAQMHPLEAASHPAVAEAARRHPAVAALLGSHPAINEREPRLAREASYSAARSGWHWPWSHARGGYRPVDPNAHYDSQASYGASVRHGWGGWPWHWWGGSHAGAPQSSAVVRRRGWWDRIRGWWYPTTVVYDGGGSAYVPGDPGLYQGGYDPNEAAAYAAVDSAGDTGGQAQDDDSSGPDDGTSDTPTT